MNHSNPEDVILKEGGKASPVDPSPEIFILLSMTGEWKSFPGR
jgi:hypothetical protein